MEQTANPRSQSITPLANGRIIPQLPDSADASTHRLTPLVDVVGCERPRMLRHIRTGPKSTCTVRMS